MSNELQSAYQQEKQQLKKTAAEIERQLKKLEAVPRYIGDDITEQALEDIRETQRHNLKMASNEPYFGRLDFQEEGQKETKPIYLGKAGVSDEKSGEVLIVDWRAPAASMFYSFTGGDELAFYQSPEGLIEGDIHLKRNIVIRKQTLQRVVDTYVKGEENVGAADEFLLYRLGENKDNRLKDIVSTIQSEQNAIIRSPKNKPMVIQGVAGSGKTTVALHRLAYLLYEYRENILAEKMIIFAPNSMFLDYISNVLPELGVGGIQQTTFNEWALEMLDDQVKLKDSTAQLKQRFSVDSDSTESGYESPTRIKGSVAFMKWIEECFDRYGDFAVPDKDFQAWEGTVLKAETIRHWFTYEYKHYPLAKRRVRIVNRLKTWIETRVKEIPERHLQRDFKKKANQRLRTYLNKWPEHTPFSFYKQLFNKTKRPDWLPHDLPEHIPQTVIDLTSRNCKKKEIEAEDLAPLAYIRNRLYGIDKKQKFHHVVIDEAQDFSPFQIALLKQMTQGNSFSILGDLSQGIHDYQGVHDWDEFLQIFKEDEPGYYQLEKSYRSTMEIIHFANAVISAGTKPVTLASPVFRSGEKVNVMETSSDHRLDEIVKTVQQIKQGEANSIAVVGRTEEECEDIHAILQQAGLDAQLINAKQSEYGGGLSVIPIYLTKGLEFDAVLITDVDAQHYKKTERDAKLLYVGCTRALHDLRLHYAGERSPLLSEVDKV